MARRLGWIWVASIWREGTGDGPTYVGVAPMFYNPVPRVGTVTIAGLSGVNPDATLLVNQFLWR